jgi:hypothetical protein
VTIPFGHLIYTSRAIKPFNADDLKALLQIARANNTKLEITGILLYIDQTFFQILEGEIEKINTLFAKIKLDIRHDKIIEIISEPINKRTFPDWSMGFVTITDNNLEVEGINNFFSTGEILQNLTISRSRKILEAFSKGYWRNKIH